MTGGLDRQKGLELVNSVKGVSRETQQRLTVFHDLLKQWQTRINLIAPSTVNHIWERHIADSMQCCLMCPDVRHVLDIGSGAGFPGLVQAILFAELGTGRVELVESNGKKCAFLNAVIRETGLRKAGVDVRVHQGRIEAVLPKLEQPELITARALASLQDLLRLTETFLGKGSVGLFPKGRDHQAEIAQARETWQFDCEVEPSRFEDGSVLLKITGLRSL